MVAIAGKLAYLIGGAQVLWDYEPVKAELRAIVEGELIEREFNLQDVCRLQRTPLRRTHLCAPCGYRRWLAGDLFGGDYAHA